MMNGLINQVPVFWRFQILGWIIFICATFPAKLLACGDLLGALYSCLFRDGISFALTLLLRKIYRRIYRANKNPYLIASSILIGSASAAFLQLPPYYWIGEIYPYEESTIFGAYAAVGILGFRGAQFLGWSILYFGIKIWIDKSSTDLRIITLESEKKNAELQMLRAQMNPHFLFNALTSIRAGIGRPEVDVKGAIQALADFLRYSLEHRREGLVTIKAEVDAVGSYLVVEKSRFREDLDFEIKLNENLHSVLVPGVFLQPLVENAVKYGWKTSPRPLKLRVTVEQPCMGILRIEVSNSGHWQVPSGIPKTGGVGLGNLRARLDLLYPGSHKFETVAVDGWVTIQIDIPSDYDTTGTTRSNH